MSAVKKIEKSFLHLHDVAIGKAKLNWSIVEDAYAAAERELGRTIIKADPPSTKKEAADIAIALYKLRGRIIALQQRGDSSAPASSGMLEGGLLIAGAAIALWLLAR